MTAIIMTAIIVTGVVAIVLGLAYITAKYVD